MTKQAQRADTPRNKGDRDIKAIIRESYEWPSIMAAAAEYGIPERIIRGGIERHQVEAFRTDVIRVNPESLEAFLESRYYGG